MLDHAYLVHEGKLDRELGDDQCSRTHPVLAASSRRLASSWGLEMKTRAA
jgi:hypothetical protein